MLKEHLGRLQDQIENYFKTKLRYTPQYWNEMPFDNIAQKQNAYSTAVFNHLDSIRHILDGFEKELTPIQSRFDISQMDGDAQTTAFMRFDSFANTLSDLTVALDCVLSMKKGYSHVLKYKESDGFFLAACPIDVGQIMHDGLLETSTSVVFTSATLANASGNFGVRGIEWATGYTYLDTERRFRSGLYLPNPFDYQNRARVFLCDDTPSIHEQSFVPFCLEKIYPTIEKLEGELFFYFLLVFDLKLPENFCSKSTMVSFLYFFREWDKMLLKNLSAPAPVSLSEWSLLVRELIFLESSYSFCLLIKFQT